MFMRGPRNFCRGGGGGGGPGQSDKKSSDVSFFFFVLSLFFIYKGSIGGPTHFRGGSNCLFPIETHITCDFPGGESGPPVPPSGPTLDVLFIGMCGLSSCEPPYLSMQGKPWNIFHSIFGNTNNCWRSNPEKNCYSLHDNMANTKSKVVAAIDSEYFASIFAKRGRCSCGRHL